MQRQQVSASNKKPVKTRLQNRLTTLDRIRVIKAYRENYAVNNLAKQFSCSNYQIRSIIKNRKKILSEYTQSQQYLDAKKARLEKTGTPEVILLFEKVLFEWFQRAQRHVETGPITNEIILRKAKQVKVIFDMINFKTDLEWLIKFRNKYDITDVDMNLLSIPNGNEPLLLDLNQIAVDVAEQNPRLQCFPYIGLEDISDWDASDIESDYRDDVLEQALTQVTHIQIQPTEWIPSPTGNHEQIKTFQQELTSQEIQHSPNDNDVDIKIEDIKTEMIEWETPVVQDPDPIKQIPQQIAPQNSSGIQVKTELIDWVKPPIGNDEQARRYLKPLEEYVLMKENYRAIGLIAQLEKLLNSTDEV